MASLSTAGDELGVGDFDELPRSSSSYNGAPPARGKRPPLSKKVIPVVFITVISVMIAISFILSIARSVLGSHLNILLGISLVGLFVVQFIIILLARTGGIPRQKTWFIYVIGLCLFTECILTNVVMFHA